MWYSCSFLLDLKEGGEKVSNNDTSSWWSITFSSNSKIEFVYNIQSSEVSMGEHGDGSQQMLQEFTGIRVKQQGSAGKLKSLQQVLNMKKGEVAFAHSNLAELQQEGVEKMKLIGNLGDLVGEIPEYKKRISALSESVDQSQRATQAKLEEMLKVRQKQDRESTMVEERIQAESVKEKVREQTNLEELEKLLRAAQEIEVGNGRRKMEKEKEQVEEQTRMLEQENRLMRENHNRKIQMMNNQLLEANKGSDQSKVMSMEVVRKDMEMMKQEYESQLGDLANQIAAFKERKSGQQAAAKKKKVSFAFPGDVSSGDTENQDDEKIACGFIDEPWRRSVHNPVNNIPSSRLSNPGREELGNEDGLESWRQGADTTGVAPHRLKCASSFSSSTPAVSGRETSALGEDHSEAGENRYYPSSFKFVARPAVKSREMSAGAEADMTNSPHHSLFKFVAAPAIKSIETSARAEAGRTTSPHHSPFKFVARPAESSMLGLSTDFCTFATRQQMVCIIHLKSADPQMKLTSLSCFSCIVHTIV